jgi:hypothetical protein
VEVVVVAQAANLDTPGKILLSVQRPQHPTAESMVVVEVLVKSSGDAAVTVVTE